MEILPLTISDILYRIEPIFDSRSDIPLYICYALLKFTLHVYFTG